MTGAAFKAAVSYATGRRVVRVGVDIAQPCFLGLQGLCLGFGFGREDAGKAET